MIWVWIAVVGLSVWAVILMAILWIGRRLRTFRDHMDLKHGEGWPQ